MPYEIGSSAIFKKPNFTILSRDFRYERDGWMDFFFFFRNEKLSGDRDTFERVYITQDGSLRLDNVSPEDEGKYVCHAENHQGKVNAASSLTVHCKCTKIYISLYISTVVCNVNSFFMYIYL